MIHDLDMGVKTGTAEISALIFKILQIKALCRVPKI